MFVEVGQGIRTFRARRVIRLWAGRCLGLAVLAHHGLRQLAELSQQGMNGLAGHVSERDIHKDRQTFIKIVADDYGSVKVLNLLGLFGRFQ